MDRHKLISILADGELHSGQDLARALGISRAGVWKQLSQLEELGIAVERLHGKGYRLAEPLDLLESDRLYSAIGPEQSKLIRLHILDVTPSTNDFLASQQPQAKYEVCVAEKQSAGKGRRGRRWEGAFARDIALSIKFESDRGVSGLDGLSLAVGVAVAESLAALGVEGVGLKWPNDLWLDQKKLAGILLELSGEIQTRCQVVIGVGLNVYMQVENGVSIDQPWTSLALENGVPEQGRNQIAATLISDLVAALERFEHEGFSYFRARWDRLDVLKGRNVFVVGQELAGVGAGIDERGAYCLQTSDGEKKLNAGEVSVRAGS